MSVSFSAWCLEENISHIIFYYLYFLGYWQYVYYNCFFAECDVIHVLKLTLAFLSSQHDFKSQGKNLTLSWQRPISYRNQSIDLLCKSMDWFLYDIGLRHERVKYVKNKGRTKEAFPIKWKAFLIIYKRLSLKQKKNFFWRWEFDFKIN